MSFFDVLWTVFIRPLELMFELIFSIANRIENNPAVDLIVMSLAINFIVLPLYRRADIIQQKARDDEKRLSPMINHIKKSFKGDERVMMLQTFYKQQNYSPLSSMKSIISLLLQIPFFIAAYQFLSHLPLLEGVSMGPIKDLLAPDGLLTIGGVTLNVLPILMTVINIISSEIYTHGQPFKDKIVLYLSALIFLVLLYTSPAGLVFYWTFNNVFSLVKNIFYKLKNPGFVFKVLCALTGVAGIVYGIIRKMNAASASEGTKAKDAAPVFGTAEFVFVIVVFSAMIIPLVLHFIFRNKEKKEIKPLTKAEKMIYICGTLFLSAFVGFLIPSSVVQSCPEDFVYHKDLFNPTHYVWYAFFIALGVFVIWLSVYYLLSDDKGRRIFSLSVLIVSAVAVLNHMVFGVNTGTLSTEMKYDYAPEFPVSKMIINLASIAAVIAVFCLLFKFIPKIMGYVLLSGFIVVLMLGRYNLYSITKTYDHVVATSAEHDNPVITLSRNGRNVIVFMMDRALGGLVPYMFQENPKLQQQFDGFTYYPNTMSFGTRTIHGAPPLFGGYEYTPDKMNARTDELLVNKHNEALLVMPRLFSEAGFYTTVIDPPYGNYTYFDLSYYDEYENIHAYNAEQLLNPHIGTIIKQTDAKREYNIPSYCLFRILPTFMQPSMYDEGNYLSLGVDYSVYDDSEPIIPQETKSVSEATGQLGSFLNAYTVLENLVNITNISDEEQCFVMMENSATHEASLLDEANGYVPANKINNKMYDLAHASRTMNTQTGRPLNLTTVNQMAHYHCNMASYIQIGKWFDYLRENGLWDNTKIIFVADHGRDCGHFTDMVYKDLDLDTEFLNPVLMVKDFGASGFTTNDEFMTQADVPTLAFKDVIDNPVNPYTGNAINSDAKYAGPQLIFETKYWRPDTTAYKFREGRWFSVHDNIFDRNNWKFEGEY